MPVCPSCEGICTCAACERARAKRRKTQFDILLESELENFKKQESEFIRLEEERLRVEVFRQRVILQILMRFGQLVREDGLSPLEHMNATERVYLFLHQFVPLPILTDDFVVPFLQRFREIIKNQFRPSPTVPEVVASVVSSEQQQQLPSLPAEVHPEFLFLATALPAQSISASSE